MKKLGRKHRPFFRVCAVDSRAPRDGKVIEELGTYDPMVNDTDARAILKSERIDYWLSVGAKPSDKVSVLIKKYGSNGTHLDAQKQALERIAAKRPQPLAPQATPAAEEAIEEAAAEEAAVEATAETGGESPNESE